MGWSGYDLYDGDETQTCHINFLKWAKVEKNTDIILEHYLKINKTIIPKEKT